MTIRIGIDFDNTIAGYDNVFLRVAKEIKLIPSDFEGSKKSIRDAIRKLDDGENKWQCLQGRVYGRNMKDAHMIDGVADFLSYCRNLNDVDIYIVSHKTEYGHYDPMKINLRDAAMSWMESNKFFKKETGGFGIDRERVFFEFTRNEKLERIRILGCCYFIDDLEEVLNDIRFPQNTRRILFTNGATDNIKNISYDICQSWHEIKSIIFAHGREST